MAQDDDDSYFAFVISDSEIHDVDSLRLYLDANRNGGDPDTADYYFVQERDGDLTAFQGIGTNDDGQLWQPTTTEAVTAAVGQPSADQWVVEMALDRNALGTLANPFGMMVGAVFDIVDVVVWPDGADPDDAATWVPVDNPACP